MDDCGGLHSVLSRRVYCAAFVAVRQIGSVGVFDLSHDGSAPLRAEVGMKRQKSRPWRRGRRRCDRPPALLRWTRSINRLVSQSRVKM
jgi:hypothetical protein